MLKHVISKLVQVELRIESPILWLVDNLHESLLSLDCSTTIAVEHTIFSLFNGIQMIKLTKKKLLKNKLVYVGTHRDQESACESQQW